METRGWDTVRSELVEVRVQLTSGADAASGHTCRAEVVELTLDWGGELQGSEVDMTGPRCPCTCTRRRS